MPSSTVISSLYVSLAPLAPLSVILPLAVLGTGVCLLALRAGARGALARLLAVAVLTLALLNPTMIREERVSEPDVAVVVVDDSPSQFLGSRQAQITAALDHLKNEIAGLENVDLRIITTEKQTAATEDNGTSLFGTLNRGLAEIPAARVAGVVMITDGQVHDVPGEGLGGRIADVPLHVLLTGEREEKDRRLIIENAPRYGIVGQDVTLSVRLSVPQDKEKAVKPMRLIVRRDGEAPFTWTVTPGKTAQRVFRINHGGENLFEIEAPVMEGELTAVNNRALAVVNGVRDRLKVLLISGEPYAGERVWRNFLKSDPSVDLVHFTILRPPEKQDMTPVNELALIAFPIRELFEEKLDDFDLIIFDHYKRRGLLPWAYFKNIVSYVRGGGAVLDSVGPDFATPLSLYRTPLGELLPGAPTGEVIEAGYHPAVTGLGERHPVTQALRPMDKTLTGDSPAWGRWFRQIEVGVRQGDVIMDGAQGKPLLILDKVGKGRVAQILSDHIWLWARGFEGGGPQGELLRRLSHWLMKEPELEEESLTARSAGEELVVTRRSLLQTAANPVTVTTPTGAIHHLELKPLDGGRLEARMAVTEPGLYQITDGVRKTAAAVGTLNPLEFADVRSSETPLAAVTKRSGGALLRVSDGALPAVRQVDRGDKTAGGDWVGLTRTGSHRVTGLALTPFLPAGILLVLILGALIAAWKREGG